MNPSLDHWQLRERPFELVTDRRFFFQSQEHDEALARLRYLVAERTMYAGLLSGEIGCGKSITGRVFAAGLDPAQHAVVFFENAHFRFADHIRQFAHAAGLGQSAARARTAAQVYELARAAVSHLHDREHRHVVLVFDEAQDLRADTLADLKRLLNLNDDGTGRLTLILIGQPEMRLRIRAHAPLDQRISLRYHLGGMRAADCSAYLRHRLRIAGHPTGDLFEAAAEQLLATAGAGVPREINRLAKLALETARAEGAAVVAEDHVQAVFDDLNRHRTLPSPLAAIP
jgi:general secretion pathway protein A